MKIYLMIALALLCATPASAEDCSLKLQASFDLTFAANGDVLVPVTVGNKEYPFLLSIAAMHSAVTQKLADEAGAKTHDTYRQTEIIYQGQQTTKAAILPSIMLGHIVGENIDTVLVPGPFASSPYGSLGLDLLSRFDMELDLSARKLNLFSQQHCEGKVVYWGKPYEILPIETGAMHDIHFLMNLDGHPLDASFTDSAFAKLGMSDADNYLGIDPTDPKLVARPEVGNYYSYPFKTLSAGGISIANPDILLFPQKPSETCRIAANDLRSHATTGDSAMACYQAGALRLGRKQLRALHLYFAFGEKKLYVTAADPAPPPTVP